MGFLNKKILLMCKETYSYPLHFLAQKWMRQNDVAAFFFMPAECKYKESLLNTTTYYAFVRLEHVKMYDVCDMADEFTKHYKMPQVDYAYLDYIQEKYTHFKNLNMQIMSSQFTTRYYHYRNYYKMFTHEQQMYWLQLNYKRVIEVLDDFQPDIIIDSDMAELPRTIMNEVAYVRNIPYITIEYPRYEGYRLYTYQMGVGIDSYFKKVYEAQMRKSKEELVEEYHYLEDFNHKSRIMSEEYQGGITSQYDKMPLIETMKYLLGKIIYFTEQDFVGKAGRLKRDNPLIYQKTSEMLKYFWRVERVKRHLYGKNKYFEMPVGGEKYVYMPLHLIPESSTFVKAPTYVNELEIIEAVSKALPYDWKLYVKEHQSMLGERGVSFYKAVKRLPNVRLVQINYYRDPKPWIINAKAVITITGTSAYEAALLGKPAIVFGDVPFQLIDGITRVKSFEELPDLLKNIDVEIDNRKSCAAYIAAVKEAGSDIEQIYLMREGENILFGRSEMSEKFENAIERLDNFYQRAYELYGK